jgi:hypothetical protein
MPPSVAGAMYRLPLPLEQTMKCKSGSNRSSADGQKSGEVWDEIRAIEQAIQALAGEIRDLKARAGAGSGVNIFVNGGKVSVEPAEQPEKIGFKP